MRWLFDIGTIGPIKNLSCKFRGRWFQSANENESRNKQQTTKNERDTMKTMKLELKKLANNENVKVNLMALPMGFLTEVESDKGGTTYKPVSQKVWRELSGLGNAESKREYRKNWQKFTAAASADMSAQIAMGMMVKHVKVSSTGERGYRLGEMKGGEALGKVKELTAVEVDALAAKSLGMSVEEFKALKESRLPKA